MFKYTAKNFSVAHDLRMAARWLATQGIKSKFQGMTLTAPVDLTTVQYAALKGYKKFGF